MAKVNYSRRKNIVYPRHSEQLAEFIGIFLGDGSFGNKYQISISWNHKCEKDYARHIQKMAYRLFGVQSRIRVREQYGSAEVVVNSSNLVDYLRKLIGIKSNEAKRLFKFPKWISKNIRYKIGFLRGIFDSEGCIYRHQYYSNTKTILI